VPVDGRRDTPSLPPPVRGEALLPAVCGKDEASGGEGMDQIAGEGVHAVGYARGRPGCRRTPAAILG